MICIEPANGLAYSKLLQWCDKRFRVVWNGLIYVQMVNREPQSSSINIDQLTVMWNGLALLQMA